MEKFLYKRIEKQNPKINLCYMYPGPESFAMSSLGYLNIFMTFDLNPDILPERVYIDTKNLPYEPKKADCIGFSFSFETDILTIIKMLKKYNIPLKASDRKKNDPIVFAGGPVLMSNPLPYEEFFDFISIGEKDCLNETFIVIAKKSAREDTLKELSDIDGIYVPKYKKSPIKITRDDLGKKIVYTPILSDKSYFKDTFIIELERGCPKMCNFCLASWLNLPVRFAPYEKIIEAIDLGLKYTNKLALLGAYVAGHPDFDRIIEYISKISQSREIELSLSSLRADLTDKKLVETLVKCGQKTATIALEAGSQKLRDYIKKDLSEEQILNTIKVSALGGLKGLKIYTMIGLPKEDDEDVRALVELVKKIKKLIKDLKIPFEITISTSTFIPKAHTPFENAFREDKAVLNKRINYLKKNLHKLGVTFRPSSIDWDTIQSILSRYPKTLAEFLIEVSDKGGNLGAFKQTWREYYKKGLLESFEESQNILSKNPAWGFIDCGNSNLKQLRQKEL